MVARGRDYVLETQAAAEALGASRLAAWARQVGAVCADLAERESAQPGFTARWHEERRQARAQEAQAQVQLQQAQAAVRAGLVALPQGELARC